MSVQHHPTNTRWLRLTEAAGREQPSPACYAPNGVTYPAKSGAEAFRPYEIKKAALKKDGLVTIFNLLFAADQHFNFHAAGAFRGKRDGVAVDLLSVDGYFNRVAFTYPLHVNVIHHIAEKAPG